uniref:Uncharacterized protein n=1 Tax=Arundo donax TaxID=35708 RepID=A0A0A9AY74_ARUDO
MWQCSTTGVLRVRDHPSDKQFSSLDTYNVFFTSDEVSIFLV